MKIDNTRGIIISDGNEITITKGKNYLFVVGIDHYLNFPKLFNAVKDAKELVLLLHKKYDFDPHNTYTLYDENATRKNIYNAIRFFQENLTSIDNLIIYFSGHGEFDKIDNEGFWIPVDAEAGENYNYIPNSIIRNKLSTIPVHHLFVMSDSCFSGSLFAQGTSKNVTKRYEKDPSRWGLTAGRNEIVSDGEQGRNSPFAESLLFRLNSNTGSISVQELCYHVVEHVLANAEQTPIGEPLQIAGHKNGQFVFHIKKDPTFINEADNQFSKEIQLKHKIEKIKSAARKEEEIFGSDTLTVKLKKAINNMNLKKERQISGTGVKVSEKDIFELFRSNTPVLINFFADWCGYCHSVESIFEHYKDVFENKIIFYKIDVDSNEELCKKFKIKSVPYTFLIQNDKKIWEQAGSFSEDEFLSIIANYYS